MKLLFAILFLSSPAFAILTSGGNATALQGTPVSVTGPSTNQCLVSPDGASWAPGSCAVGTGNFTGPGSSVTHNLMGFADTTGALGEDSGIAAANVCLLTGNQTVAGIKTLSSAPVMSALTASLPVCTGSGKALSSTCAGLVPWADIVTGNNYRLIATGAAGVPAEAAAITASKALCSDANGIPVACASGPSTTTMSYVDATSSIQTQLNALKIEQLDGQLKTPGNDTFPIRPNAFYGGTINSIYIGTVSGTITVAVNINGSPVTGLSAISVSSSAALSTASAANTFSATDQITLVTTSDSSAVGLFWSMKVTR